MEKSEVRRLTVEEYRALEAISDEPTEYRDGFVVALAVPTKNHERISMNLSIDIGPVARRRGCDVYAGGANILAPSGDRMIPDFVITCDERDMSDAQERGDALILHPWLVMEILSPTTAADDATAKFDSYQSISERTHYILNRFTPSRDPRLGT